MANEVLSLIDRFAFHFVAIGPYLAEIWQIPYLILETQGQCYGQGQSWWSYLRPRVQSICLFFVSWQTDHFWLRYSKFHMLPWKWNIEGRTKIDQNRISEAIDQGHQSQQKEEKSNKMFGSYRVNKSLWSATTDTKTWSHPQYTMVT